MHFIWILTQDNGIYNDRWSKMVPIVLFTVQCVSSVKKIIKMKLFIVCLMVVAVAHATPFHQYGGLGGGYGSGVANSQSFAQSQSNTQTINQGTGLGGGLGYGGYGGYGGSQVGSSASSSATASTSTSNQIGMKTFLKFISNQ